MRSSKKFEDIIVKAIIPGGPEENQSGGVSLGSIFGNLGNLILEETLYKLGVRHFFEHRPAAAGKMFAGYATVIVNLLYKNILGR